ncbi:MAG: hypothetical protein K8R73_12155 [Clostridiales bacterium]|nr:hypothetical protein [Clostridiales bacterium]
MNKLLALTRIQLKDFFSKYTQQLNIKNKFLGKLMIFLPIFILLPVIQIIKQLYDTFLLIGYPELIITYVYVGATMLAFFMAIPLVISIFFYSKDLSLIATLPVKEDTVVFSKLASVYVYLFGMGALLFGTSVGFYAFGDGFNLFYLLMGIVALLLLPVLPMIFATLVIMPFMAVIGGKSNRNLMVIIGNIVLLAVILGIQVVFTRVEMDPASLQKMVSQQDGLISLVGSKFPPSIWLTKMVRGSLLDTIWFLLLNLGFVVTLKLFAKRLYKNALLKYNQQSSTGKKGVIKYTQSSKKMLLIKRHLGIIIHNPTFLLNTVLTLFIPILLFGIYTAMGIMSLETLRNPMLEPFAIFIFIGIIVSPSIVGSLSATAITREGKAFWETRVLPLSAEENISARIQTTVLINGFATAALALATFWILPLGIIDIILALVASAAAIVCFATIDLIINIERPYLNWSNPTAAVKNNLNIMISLISRIVLGGLGYGLFKLVPDLSSRWMLGIFTVLLLVVYFIGRKLVYGPYKQKFIDMNI